MKRFYTLVSTADHADGHVVLLDGKAIKTPAKHDMVAPTSQLAEAIMQEWADQKETINADMMPLTQFLSTKIDRVRAQRDEISTGVLKYLNTDMICYYTDRPEELRAAQEKAWQPVHDFIAQKFGTNLETTDDIQALTQPQKLQDSVRAYVEGLDEDRFTLLQIVTSLVGSICVAMMFIEGQISPEDALATARVEERFKDTLYDAEKYGQDPMFAKKDKAAMVDLIGAKTYIAALA